jgi:tetratricopeptide (TPR) repeat protein
MDPTTIGLLVYAARSILPPVMQRISDALKSGHSSSTLAIDKSPIVAALSAALRAQKKPEVAASAVSMKAIDGVINYTFDRILDTSQVLNDKLVIRLDHIGKGLDHLGASFDKLMGDVIFKLELQQDLLKDILEHIANPLRVQADEFRRRAEDAYKFGWYDQAIADLQQAKQLNYQDYTVYRMLGNIYYYHRKNLDLALNNYMEAVQYAAPRDVSQAAECCLYVSYVYDDMGNHLQDAIYYSTAALRYNASLSQAHFDLARYFAKNSDPQSSVIALRSAIEGDARYFERTLMTKELKAVPKIRRFLTKMEKEIKLCVSDLYVSILDVNRYRRILPEEIIKALDTIVNTEILDVYSEQVTRFNACKAVVDLIDRWTVDMKGFYQKRLGHFTGEYWVEEQGNSRERLEGLLGSLRKLGPQADRGKYLPIFEKANSLLFTLDRAEQIRTKRASQGQCVKCGRKITFLKDGWRSWLECTDCSPIEPVNEPPTRDFPYF